MKITRKKRRMRKTVGQVRNLFFVLAGIFALVAVSVADSTNLVYIIIATVLAIVCWFIGITLDEILWQTAWPNLQKFSDRNK